MNVHESSIALDELLPTCCACHETAHVADCALSGKYGFTFILMHRANHSVSDACWRVYVLNLWTVLPVHAHEFQSYQHC